MIHWRTLELQCQQSAHATMAPVAKFVHLLHTEVEPKVRLIGVDKMAEARRALESIGFRCRVDCNPKF